MSRNQSQKRRHKLAKTLEHRAIIRNNTKHSDNPKPFPECIHESPDDYVTLKCLPKNKTDRIYVYSADYRCDHWDEPDMYGNKPLSIKIHVQTHSPQKKQAEIITLSSPPSSVVDFKKHTGQRNKYRYDV